VGVTAASTLVNVLSWASWRWWWVYRDQIALPVQSQAPLFPPPGDRAQSIGSCLAFTATTPLFFLCFCSLILAISVNRKWSIWFTLLISLAFHPAYLHFCGHPRGGPAINVTLQENRPGTPVCRVHHDVGDLCFRCGATPGRTHKNFVMLEKASTIFSR